MRAMLRIDAGEEADGLARLADDPDAGGLLADRAPVVQRLERDVVREDDEEHQHDDDRRGPTRTIATGDAEAQGERDDDADLDHRVEEAGEES